LGGADSDRYREFIRIANSGDGNIELTATKLKEFFASEPDLFEAYEKLGLTKTTAA
jgi:hypothetical protein